MKHMFALSGPFNRNSIGRFFSIAVPAVLMFLVVGGGGCKKKDGPTPRAVTRPVKVTTVVNGTAAGPISLPGRTRANRRANLSFKVSGPLVQLPVEEGQTVKRGQFIARIDPRDFETNLRGIKSALSEAKANFKSMKRGARVEDIRILESEIDAARAQYLFAEDQDKRYRQLWIKRHVSRAEFERYAHLRDTAKAKLEAAEQNLAKGETGAREEDIEAMQSRISGLEAKLKAAKDALDDTCLKAPFAGVVAKRHVENHQEIQAKQPIVFLQDISAIEILLDVPETMMTRFRTDDDADVVARFAVAPKRTFPLRLKEFSTDADPKTQTYQVVMVMPRPEGINILPGMTAAVESDSGFPAGDGNRIVVPAIAVTEDSKKEPFVWVLNEAQMTVQRAMVRVGEMTGDDGIVIREGLAGGEKVVTAGITKLQAGMRVSIWDASM